MTDTLKNPNNQVAILPGLKLMGALALLIGIGLFVLNSLNTRRSEALRQQYTEETRTFIAANQSGLNTLFTQVFDDAETCTNTTRATATLPCDQEISNQIFTIIDLHPLKDFSSTSFVRLRNNKVSRLSLSGYVSEYPDYREDTDKLIGLLQGKLGESYLFTEKYSSPEVMVVFKKDDQVLGAIVRPILER